MTILRQTSPKVMLMTAEHEKCLRGYDERHGADTIQRTPIQTYRPQIQRHRAQIQKQRPQIQKQRAQI